MEAIVPVKKKRWKHVIFFSLQLISLGTIFVFWYFSVAEFDASRKVIVRGIAIDYDTKKPVANAQGTLNFAQGMRLNRNAQKPQWIMPIGYCTTDDAGHIALTGSIGIGHRCRWPYLHKKPVQQRSEGLYCLNVALEGYYCTTMAFEYTSFQHKEGALFLDIGEVMILRLFDEDKSK